MLIQRFITAIFLLSLVILGMLYLPHLAFTWVWSSVCLLALWEWQRLANCCAKCITLGFLASQAIVMYGVYQIPSVTVLTVGLGVWLFLSIAVIRYPQGWNIWRQFLGIRLMMGTLVVIPAWYAVLYLRCHNEGFTLLLLMLLIVWSSDSGAYFAGRYAGHRPLAPAISPNKTYEGMVGGMIMAGLVTLGYAYWVLQPYYFTFGFAIIILATMIMSIMGDLFESAVKRQAGVKDSGTIVWGHGGILDRLDSLFAAAPIFAFGIRVLDGF